MLQFPLENIFQFLLVRLKDLLVTAIGLFAVISIPTGTIKSSKVIHLATINIISIPTGTIKSIL